MSNQKSFKTAELALTDFDLYLIQNLSYLPLRNSEIFSDFKAYGAREFPVLCLFQNGLL